MGASQGKEIRSTNRHNNIVIHHAHTFDIVISVKMKPWVFKLLQFNGQRFSQGITYQKIIDPTSLECRASTGKRQNQG